MLSQITAKSFGPRHVEKINTLVAHLCKTDDLALTFFALHKSSLKMFIYCDGSFAIKVDLSSQIVYIVLLADRLNRPNIVHYSSTKAKRIVRSVLLSLIHI